MDYAGLREYLDAMKQTKTAQPEPTISMRDFLELPEIKAAQEIQKRNPYRSEPHRKAHDAIMAEATKYGAQNFIGDY